MTVLNLIGREKQLFQKDISVNESELVSKVSKSIL